MEIFQKNLKELISSPTIKNELFDENNFDYHTIVGDVVVSYSMSNEDIEKQKRIRERWLKCFNIYNDQSLGFDCKVNQIKSILTDFEFQQCKLSHFSMLGNSYEKPIDYTYQMPDLLQKIHLIGINHTKEFLEAVASGRSSKIPQLQKINKYDRNGKLYNAFRTSLNNQIYYMMYFNENTIFQSDSYQDPDSKILYDTILYKVDKETGIKTLVKLSIPRKTLSHSFSFVYTEGNDVISPIKRIEYSSFNMDDCINKFTSEYYKLTGKVFPSKELTFEPNNDFFGQFSLNKPPFNTIPSLTKLLFSVLRQKIVRTPQIVETLLDKLPDSLLQDFLFDCLNDTTPNGLVCTNIILSNLKQDSNIKTPTERDILNLSAHHDHWFAFSFEKEISQNIFVPTYSNSFKINIYHNYENHKIKEWIPENENEFIFKAPLKKPIGSPSMVEKEQFLRNFNKLTESVINSEFDWSNTVVTGSTITASLTGDIDGFNSDVNVLFYGLDRNEITTRIMKYYSSLPIHCKPSIVNNFKNIISICSHYPTRSITFQLEPYLNIEHILVTADINCCGFVFDGENVYGLLRSIESMNYRTNFTHQYSWMLHGDIHYQHRLVKYYEKGFSVVSPDYNYFVNNKDFSPHFSNGGLALLAASAISSNIYTFLQQPFSHLPYGPKWNKEEFEKKIGIDGRFHIIPHYDLEQVCKNSTLKRKFSSMSSNSSPFISIEPRIEPPI